MRSPLGVIIFISIMLLLDWYIFQAVRGVMNTSSARFKLVLSVLFAILSFFAITGFLLFVYTDPEFLGKKLRTYIFSTVIGLFMAKVIAVTFFLIDDVRRLIQWMAGRFLFRNTEAESMSSDGISRSAFLTWLGIGLGSTLFGTLVYGYSNKYNYKVKKTTLSLSKLPAAFKGYRIAHISDIHSGSLMNKEAVLKGIELLLEQKPDIILFTGDIVNDRASEMDEYKDVFSLLRAPDGVFSTLGNHDYGDYVQWPDNGISKERNLQNVKNVHQEIGWRLLMNEHVILKRGEDSIALLGIENWSAKARFPKHGRMDLAYAGAENQPFKILMSHDPSHWEAEILTKYTDIDLMLSGHTHGMQFGVDIKGFQWSPVQYVYKQWAGLYKKGTQHLYVNRGFGFIGYPGRVGVLPEITILDLV